MGGYWFESSGSHSWLFGVIGSTVKNSFSAYMFVIYQGVPWLYTQAKSKHKTLYEMHDKDLRMLVRLKMKLLKPQHLRIVKTFNLFLIAGTE